MQASRKTFDSSTNVLPAGNGPARLRRLRHRDQAAAYTLDLVAGARAIETSALLQSSRGVAPLAFARQLAMYLVHVMLGRSLTDVGEVFGRDRTTVAHACALIEDMREDGEFDDMVAGLEASIESALSKVGEADRAAG